MLWLQKTRTWGQILINLFTADCLNAQPLATPNRSLTSWQWGECFIHGEHWLERRANIRDGSGPARGAWESNREDRRVFNRKIRAM